MDPQIDVWNGLRPEAGDHLSILIQDGFDVVDIQRLWFMTLLLNLTSHRFLNQRARNMRNIQIVSIDGVFGVKVFIACVSSRSNLRSQPSPQGSKYLANGRRNDHLCHLHSRGPVHLRSNSHDRANDHDHYRSNPVKDEHL